VSKRITLPLLVLLFAGLLIGQHVNRLFWDGSDWNRIAKTVNFNPDLEAKMKSAYVNGVLDGRLFYYLKTWSAQSTFADSLYGETVDYLTTREMVRSLDEFYKDPANSYLPVPTAIIVANMYARQMSMNVIDEYIKQSRHWINDLQYQLQLEGNAEILKQKQDRMDSHKLP